MAIHEFCVTLDENGTQEMQIDFIDAPTKQDAEITLQNKYGVEMLVCEYLATQ